MKKAQIIPVMALFFVILLASCPHIPPIGPSDPLDLNTPLEDGYFYAQNTANNTFYKVKAGMVYAGENCEIWAENGSGVTREKAVEIANEYDNKIRTLIVDEFSKKNVTFSFNDKNYQFADMLKFANWLVDRDDGKLTILLLDIKDEFVEETDPFVAGYFYAGNFWSKGRIENTNYYSNGRDMIYVDTYPGLKMYTKQAYATFAHELQHLVNFVTCYLLDNNLNKITDVWVNEGLSTFAEYLYLDENPTDKCLWLGDPRNTIKTGNNFFVWGNHKDKPLAVMDDYATVYLFFRWLYLQASPKLQSHIFRDIVLSDYYDYRAVTSVAAKINSDWSNWENLLRTWFTANYYPQTGYTGDGELQKIIKVDPIKVEGNTIPLYPGEGVYSIINGTYSTTSAVNIRYAELTGNTNNMLLTFNANTNNSLSAASESGSLTGVAPPSSSISVSRTATESARSVERKGPYVIDAQDLLGRDRVMPNFPPK